MFGENKIPQFPTTRSKMHVLRKGQNESYPGGPSSSDMIVSKFIISMIKAQLLAGVSPLHLLCYYVFDIIDNIACVCL